VAGMYEEVRSDGVRESKRDCFICCWGGGEDVDEEWGSNIA
jgi:hypothetical protein